MKYRMRGHLREEKTKSSREHETVRHDSRVGEMKRTVEIKKKVRYFGNGRTGNRMAKGVAPGAIGGPLRLIIQPCGKLSGEGKLASHSRRDADRWQCETQSAPARGGSGGTDGSGADGADPDVEAGGHGPPPEGRGDPETKAGVAKREPQGSASDGGSLKPWKGPSG